MTYIVLDYDGVMRTTVDCATYNPHKFNKVSVVLLQRLLTEFDADLVICATDRKHKTLSQVKSHFNKYAGFTCHRLIGVTPDLSSVKGSSRGSEVTAYTSEHQDNYVVLDDDIGYAPHVPLVVCNPFRGFSLLEYQLARHILHGHITKEAYETIRLVQRY